MTRKLSDSAWVTNSFMLPKFAVEALSKRHLSTAFDKYTDTTLGGNFAINPPPQFTRTADIKNRGPFNGMGGYVDGAFANELRETDNLPYSRGMGRKYSEMIDDNSQLIHMRFGVPQYNSLTSFFSGFYNPTASSLARTGRSPGFFYKLGRVTGFVVTLPLQPLVLAGRIYNFLTGRPPSKYYFLKPTMPLYWNAVNAMANGIAINMGIIPRVLVSKSNHEGGNNRLDAMEGSDADNDYTNSEIVELGEIPQYTDQDIKRFHEMMPDIFKSRGGIDVYAVANRAQRVHDAVQERMEQHLSSANSFDDFSRLANSFIKEAISTVTPPVAGAAFEVASGLTGINAYLEAWETQGRNASAPIPTDKDSEDSSTITEDVSKATGEGGWWSQFASFSRAQLRDGGQFVTFRVNHTGTSSESFSSSVGESDIANKINSTSAQARSVRFNFAEGNIAGGAIGDMINGVMRGVKSFADGLTDSIGMSGIMAIFGNAYVDIPKVWQDSSVTLPTMSYEIELRTPYGNKMSRFMNLYVPLTMLLASALPRSSGKHSYTAPFLVELYDKGRAQTRLGLIDSMTITRGVGNLGWTREHEPLGINVSFTVVDLSSIMHMPLNPAPGIFDEHTSYSDYLATLGSLSLRDQIYAFNKLRLNITRSVVKWEDRLSPAKWAMDVANTPPGRILSALARETSRVD